MADYVSNDLVEMLEFKNWKGEYGQMQMLKSGRRFGFEAISGGKGLAAFSLRYQPFTRGLSDRWRWVRDELAAEELKLRSATQGVLYMSPDAVMTQYGKYSWNDWTGAGDTVPIPSPFEMRLNEFNRGKCYCEVVVFQDKKSLFSEQWWKVVAK